MKKYLFYTTDGFTQDFQLRETENCQILGIALGSNIKMAYDKLLKDNNYIVEHNYRHVMAYEVIGEVINL